MRPDFNKMELIPAIVQDYQTKEVLMLAYVNEEAYDQMLEMNQTVFYSRSRKKLWHKGEESGHFQDIKGMYLDCDLDTLLIYVKQTGVACHTGAYSCFFNEVQPYDARDIFRELEKTIADRRVHPVEKSYTNYLLNEGVDKICKKVGEEASETIIAARINFKCNFCTLLSSKAKNLFRIKLCSKVFARHKKHNVVFCPDNLSTGKFHIFPIPVIIIQQKILYLGLCICSQKRRIRI